MWASLEGKVIEVRVNSLVSQETVGRGQGEDIGGVEGAGDQKVVEGFNSGELLLVFFLVFVFSFVLFFAWSRSLDGKG